MKKSIYRITRTAILIAMLVVVQYLTSSLGQYVTGSLVNLVLAVACLAVGPVEGVLVGLISPFIAKMFGIGPAFIQLVPFVSLANATLVLLLYFVSGRRSDSKRLNLIRSYSACAVASLGKFLVIYFGITKLGFLLCPGINEVQMTKMTAMFSWPQIITALIGTVLAQSVVPPVLKALKKK